MAANVTPVVLQVSGFEDREVALFHYQFEQATDIEGQIAGLPRGGRIKVRVKAMNDGNNQLIQWMLAPNDPRDLKLVVQNSIDGSQMKTIEGKGCYCVHYQEYWADGELHYEEIEVVCQTLQNGPVSFDNPWK